MVVNIEVCANSAESCIEAAKAGATRVELCAGIPEGGTTPSYGDVRVAMEATKGTGLQILPIIRPRGGDFCYSQSEYTAMKYDIVALCSLGVDGVVFGCLTPDGRVDKERNGELLEYARTVNPNIEVAFHRAFDMTRDAMEALEDIIELGFDRILTSGHKNKAIEGADLIAEVVKKANGRIAIMPGSGVNAGNIEELIARTGAKDFHFSARHGVDSLMEFRKDGVSMGGTVVVEEYSKQVTSAEIVKEIKNIINNL